MKLFVNDRLIQLLKPEQQNNLSISAFDWVCGKLADFQDERLQGHILLRNCTDEMLQHIIGRLQTKKLKGLLSVTCEPLDYKKLKEELKSHFKIVKAAGGLVLKDDKVLMIFRLGRWDLPKGKLEKYESTEEGALREVEEEAGVKVENITKLCHTWHTYVNEGTRTLKKTSWFLMKCLDDAKMLPQVEEGIEEVKWLNRSEYEIAIKGSYGAIKQVFDAYHALAEKPA